jgi:hypothetical protein
VRLDRDYVIEVNDVRAVDPHEAAGLEPRLQVLQARAVDPKMDYSAEPTTLVEFRLEDAPGGGMRLTVIDSGFDLIPAFRRDEAFPMNSQG